MADLIVFYLYSFIKKCVYSDFIRREKREERRAKSEERREKSEERSFVNHDAIMRYEYLKV
jgi:hypothetical protein